MTTNTTELFFFFIRIVYVQLIDKAHQIFALLLSPEDQKKEEKKRDK